MSKKCFETITLYVLFLTFMVGTAVVFSYLHFDNVIAKVVIIIALIIISTTLALTFEGGSLITILFNAVLWGTLLSFLFDNMGNPKPLQVVYVALIMISWFILFCFCTNISFVKQNYVAFMILWCVVLIVADIAFAVHVKNVLGWMSLILLVPFFTFFVALPGAAEDFAEHSQHIAIYCTLPALLIVMLVLFFRVPIRSYDRGDFFPEIDKDYVFTYCPKPIDDEQSTEEDLSNFM